MRVGQKAAIKSEAWARYLMETGLDQDHPIPPPQIIIAMPAHPPFDEYVMLCFPHHWWRETDLELVKDG